MTSAVEEHGKTVLAQLPAATSASSSDNLAAEWRSPLRTKTTIPLVNADKKPLAATAPATSRPSAPAATLYQSLAKGDWENVEALLTPQTAAEKDMLGRLPLFNAITYKAPESVISSLLRAYPEAAQEKDSFGDSPFWMALKFGGVLSEPRQTQLPLQILAAYPEAAKERDQIGGLALNYAIDRGGEKFLVEKLLAAYPEAAQEKNKNGLGYLPLQIALRKDNISPEVIQRLVVAYPDAAGEKVSVLNE